MNVMENVYTVTHSEVWILFVQFSYKGNFSLPSDSPSLWIEC